MKFLIIRFSSIGDIVLTTPVVRCLKKQVLTAEIHFATRTPFKAILESNPYIDKIHCLDKDLPELIQELKDEDFDFVIDLHHNLRSFRVKQALGKKAFSFRKLNIEKWLLTAWKINRLPGMHIVDRYLETVAGIGVHDDGAGLDYFIPEKDRIREEDIPASHQAGYLAIGIGAALATKKLPGHKLRELCGKIKQPVILLGGQEDRAQGEEIASLDPARIYNACGKFNINESADLVRRSNLVITHDTGLMHIATAFRKPVISVWGNTIPAFGMYPYYGKNYLAHFPQSGLYKNELPYDIMEVNGLRCRPCSKIGYRKCPKGHFKCMEEQDVDRLVERIWNRLGK